MPILNFANNLCIPSKWRKPGWVPGVILFGLLVWGCSPLQTPQPGVQASSTPPPAATKSAPLNTATPTSSSKPGTEISPTVAATLTNSDPVLTPETPIATYPPDEKEIYILDLIRTNNDCELPCWWGIIPGESGWVDFQQIITPVHPFDGPSHQNGVFLYENLLSVNQVSVANLEIRFTGTETQIQTILVEAGLGGTPLLPEYTAAWNSYSLSKIIQQFGSPQNVYIYVQPGVAEPGGSWSYQILLFYEDQDFLISYSFDGSNDSIGLDPNTNQIVLCPNKAKLVLIGLYFRGPTAEIKLSQIARIEPLIASGFYKDLQVTTELNVNTFSELFGNESIENCFATNKNNW